MTRDNWLNVIGMAGLSMMAGGLWVFAPWASVAAVGLFLLLGSIYGIVKG